MSKFISKEVIIPALLSLVVLTACGGKELKSHWESSPIVVDGTASDWSSYPVEFYDKDNLPIVIGIVNNANSLDVMIKFRDARLARMFERRGVTLWFNGAGKKEKKFGVRYMDTNARNMGLPMTEMPERGSAMQEGFRQAAKPRGIFQLIAGDTTAIPESGLNGIKARAGVQKDIYCYEIGIPIGNQSASGDHLIISAKDKLKLGIQINPVSREERERIKERMPERNNGEGRAGGGFQGGGMEGGMGGGGMRGSGMRGGGMRGGNRSGLLSEMDGQEIWFTVELAHQAPQ